MKAVRLTEIGQPLENQEIPLPEIGVNDVLLKVKAAGICHSDEHYRTGLSDVGSLPQTLGHEIAGIVEEVGKHVTGLKVDDRVCVHYLLTCGECYYCRSGREQFCTQGQMIGKHSDGGYAEYIKVPARNAVQLPEPIPYEQAAVLMCSSSTSYHALIKSRLTPGETVAVFGVGGLGMSAVQLAHTFGAKEVYAVDIRDAKLKQAQGYGAIGVNAANNDPVEKLNELTNGKGVDVALELIGLPITMEQAVQSLGVFGRAVIAGITDKSFPVKPYKELVGKETEIIGSSDHTLNELITLIEFVQRGKLDLSQVVTNCVPLEAGPINEHLKNLASFGDPVRAVITP